MAESLWTEIEHEDASGLAREVWTCSVWETLACTIACRWTHRDDSRKTRRHKWVEGQAHHTSRVPDWVRVTAATRLAGRVRGVVEASGNG